MLHDAVAADCSKCRPQPPRTWHHPRANPAWLACMLPTVCDRIQVTEVSSKCGRYSEGALVNLLGSGLSMAFRVARLRRPWLCTVVESTCSSWPATPTQAAVHKAIRQHLPVTLLWLFSPRSGPFHGYGAHAINAQELLKVKPTRYIRAPPAPAKPEQNRYTCAHTSYCPAASSPLTHGEHPHVLGTAAHVACQALPQQADVLVVVGRHPQPRRTIPLHLQHNRRATPGAVVGGHWRHGRQLQGAGIT